MNFLIILFLLLCTALPPAVSAEWTWSISDEIISTEGSDRFTNIFPKASGGATAIWVRPYQGLPPSIMVSTQSNGVWSVPLKIYDLPFGLEVGTLSAAANGLDEIVICWSERSSSGGHATIKSIKYDGLLWGDVRALDSSAYSSVAVASSGIETFAAVWDRFNGVDSDVIQASILDRNEWSIPRTISENGRDASEPQIAGDSSGRYTAVWKISNNTFGTIQTSSYDGGSWTSSKNLSPNNISNDANSPRVLYDNNSNITIAWENRNINNNWNSMIQAFRYSDGAWGATHDISSSGINSSYPYLAANGAGDVITAWEVNSLNSIQASFFSAGQWSNPVNVSASRQEIQIFPKIYGDQGNGFVVAWNVWNPSSRHTTLKTRTYQNSIWSGEFDLGPVDIYANTLCFLQNNDAIMLWANSGLLITKKGSSNPFWQFLSVKKTGGGAITSIPTGIDCGPKCTSEFIEGSNVSLIAQPDNGFAFVGWNGACSGTGNCNITMDGRKSASANFIELPKYPVKVSKPRNGVISSEPAGISCGGRNKQCTAPFSSAKLTATPNAAYEFIRWTGCQAPEGNICHIKPTGKMAVKAAFRKLPKYNLKISKNNLGSVTSSPAGLKCPDKKRSCSVKFTKGTEITLTPVPQTGISFVGWTGACSGTDPCIFRMDSNKLVGAAFQY